MTFLELFLAVVQLVSKGGPIAPLRDAHVTCALVGNSPILSDAVHGKLWGAEIDQHQVVMRINNAPTKVYPVFNVISHTL